MFLHVILQSQRSQWKGIGEEMMMRPTEVRNRANRRKQSKSTKHQIERNIRKVPGEVQEEKRLTGEGGNKVIAVVSTAGKIPDVLF